MKTLRDFFLLLLNSAMSVFAFVAKVVPILFNCDNITQAQQNIWTYYVELKIWAPTFKVINLCFLCVPEKDFLNQNTKTHSPFLGTGLGGAITVIQIKVLRFLTL